MKAKIAVIVVCVVMLVAYGIYTQFFKEGSGADEKNARASFMALNQIGVITQNPLMATGSIAPNFTDQSVSKDDLVKIMTMKRREFNIKNVVVTVNDDTALISYLRTEARGENGQTFNSTIKNETWVRDAKNKALWKLQKLDPNDKWFRTMESPQAPLVEVAKTDAQAPGAAETVKDQTATGPVPMKPDDRYSPEGRRDPFKPLIEITEEGKGPLSDMCEPDRAREILEDYDLVAIKLSGIVEVAGAAEALIETPDGKGYNLRKDMRIGKHCGIVTEIMPDRVMIREKSRKPSKKHIGKYEEVDVDTSLQLRPEEG